MFNIRRRFTKDGHTNVIPVELFKSFNKGRSNTTRLGMKLTGLKQPREKIFLQVQ